MYFTKLIDKAELAKIKVDDLAERKYFFVVCLGDISLDSSDLALLDISLSGDDRISVVLRSHDIPEVMGNPYAAALLKSFETSDKNLPFVGVVLLTQRGSERFLPAVEVPIATEVDGDSASQLSAIGAAIDRVEDKVTVHEIFLTRITLADIRSTITWLIDKILGS